MTRVRTIFVLQVMYFAKLLPMDFGKTVGEKWSFTKLKWVKKRCYL